MIQPQTTWRADAKGRGAFTLTELLIVLAILAILSALAATGTFEVIANQRQANTETNMRVIDKILQQHWQQVVANAKKEWPSQAAINLAGGDVERAKVIWVKLRLMAAFPLSFEEIRVGSSYIPGNRQKNTSTYQRQLIQAGINLSSPILPSPTQSAACLLLALSVSRASTSLPADILANAVADTDSDGVPELVDGWGRPLAFRRFYYSPELQNRNPNTRGRAAIYCDPQDPEGKLMNLAWYNSLQNNEKRGVIYENLCGYKIVNPLNSAQANFVLPVLVSSGREDTNPDDDILSFRLKLDARGD